MQDKLVFETLANIESDDGGQSLSLAYTGQDPQVELTLPSWSEDKCHPGLERLIGKRLRITVEVLSDEDVPLGTDARELNDPQLVLVLWEMEKSQRALARECAALRAELDLDTTEGKARLDATHEALNDLSRQLSDLRTIAAERGDIAPASRP
jgi:hypothetical protein